MHLVTTIDDNSYGSQKNPPAFTLSKKKYPGFPAEKK